MAPKKQQGTKAEPAEVARAPLESEPSEPIQLQGVEPRASIEAPAPPILRLRYGYQGRPSKERVIAAGDYLADDPALFGLAEYLLKNGHAVEVTEK